MGASSELRGDQGHQCCSGCHNAWSIMVGRERVGGTIAMILGGEVLGSLSRGRGGTLLVVVVVIEPHWLQCGGEWGMGGNNNECQRRGHVEKIDKKIVVRQRPHHIDWFKRP
jgi:hypothetical protein